MCTVELCLVQKEGEAINRTPEGYTNIIEESKKAVEGAAKQENERIQEALK
jgi:hypothetical protein